jgi:hypothetical protein
VTVRSGAGDPNALTASANLGLRTGAARLEVPAGGRTAYTIADSDIDNSTCL